MFRFSPNHDDTWSPTKKFPNVFEKLYIIMHFFMCLIYVLTRFIEPIKIKAFIINHTMLFFADLQCCQPNRVVHTNTYNR